MAIRHGIGFAKAQRSSGRRLSVQAAAAGKTYVGSLVGSGLKFGIVVGRFNDLVTKLLLQGALEHFERQGVAAADVDVSHRTCACAAYVVLNTAIRIYFFILIAPDFN
jgi:hypothetical protein